MTNFMRLRSCLFTLVVLLSGQAALAQSAMPLRSPSISGSFLAGQEAFRDLRTEDASRYFLDAAQADWENPAIVERAFVALAADGRIDDAAAIGQHLLELAPGNELAHLLMGTAALKERRYTSAVTELKSVNTSSFVGITAGILHAWALVAKGEYVASQDLLDDLGRGGLDEFLVFHRALMADVAGEREAAIGYADMAYEADPYVARIVEAYARMLGNAGRFDDARKILAAYDDEGLTHPVIDQVREAVARDFRPGKLAASAQAGAAEMFHGIGSALSRDGSGDIAVVFLRLGLYLDPDSDVLAMALGQLLDDAGRHAMANKIYERLLSGSPMKVAAGVRIAENIDALGDRSEAIRRLKNIAAAQPDNLDAVSVLGDMYRYDERYMEAIEAYTRALEITGGERPRDWRFYYVRGIAGERAGEWDAAEADFLKALKLNPGHPSVLNYLGYVWVDKGINLKRALEMIREAVNSSPTDGYIVDSLGWAYYKLGRAEEAVVTLEQAVQLRPNDPEINDHLGDAYWAAGRKLEARFQWKIAATLGDRPEVTERATLKLANGLEASVD